MAEDEGREESEWWGATLCKVQKRLEFILKSGLKFAGTGITQPVSNDADLKLDLHKFSRSL